MFIENSTGRLRCRVLASCISLMQACVVAVVSHVDAMLDAERLSSPVHVESPESRDCAAQHNHLFCQVVRSLFSGPPTGRIAVAEIPAPCVSDTDRPAADVPGKSATFLIGAINPRGPPLA